MTEEEAQLAATRALCADLESWATSVASDKAYVGLTDLLQVLDKVRATTEGLCR